MGWLKIDDGLADHRKFRRLSDAAAGLWLIGGCYAAKYLTDGNLDEDFAATELDTRARRRLAAELVDRGLWHVAADGGYVIHDYLEFNPTRVEAEERKRVRAEAGRKGGLKSRAKQNGSKAEANA